MSKYYGDFSQPSDYLAHYGVKGMHWGVKKAKQSNDYAKLASHYDRALRKKAILKEHADPKAEKENAKAYAVGGAGLLGAGALGGLASYGIAKGQVAAQRALFPNDKYRMIMHPVGLYGLSGLAGLGGVAALGSAAKAAYRTTKHGNKKAVAKYNKFKTEMNKQFDNNTVKRIHKYLDDNPDDDIDYNYIKANRQKHIKHSDFNDTNYLAHYGVKGMHWGVRKAIESGNDRKLGRHYQQAMLKLHDLDKKTNRDYQKKIYNNAKRNMLVGSLGSAIGSAGLTAAMGGGPLYSAIAGGTGGLAGLMLNTTGLSARRNISDKGHARAVAKRNAWKKEMDSAFRGTRFNSKSMSKGKAAKAVKTQKALYDASLNGGLVGGISYAKQHKKDMENAKNFYRQPRKRK